jgi:hypothetical protein
LLENALRDCLSFSFVHQGILARKAQLDKPASKVGKSSGLKP